MIASLPLAIALSAVYILTGAYALVRWSATVTGPLPAARRTAELAHLLMCVAMLVMTWSWAGTTGVLAQIVLFSVFTGYFLFQVVRGYRTGVHGCVGGSAHALMSAAMVWMLAAMPLIMPMPAVSSSSGGHAGHAGHGGGGATMDMGSSAGPAGWAVVVTIVLCAALLGGSAFWVVRALRGASPADPAPDGCGCDEQQPAPGAVLAPAPPAVAAPRAQRMLGARTDACCHALMGLGMVAMLAAMVAGW